MPLPATDLGEDLGGDHVEVIEVDTLKKRLPAAALFSAAAVIFPVSLVFRSIDLALCGEFPTGTHFLWHTLNAVMLYCLLLGLLRTVTATRIRPAENR